MAEHWVYRISDVLHKITETTGTEAHTELYRMPYRIKKVKKKWTNKKRGKRVGGGKSYHKDDAVQRWTFRRSVHDSILPDSYHALLLALTGPANGIWLVPKVNNKKRSGGWFFKDNGGGRRNQIGEDRLIETDYLSECLFSRRYQTGIAPLFMLARTRSKLCMGGIYKLVYGCR